MLNYPKVLRKKDLKKIEKYPCDEEIKEAYKKYLTNYSFEEFAEYCEDNSQKIWKVLFSSSLICNWISSSQTP